MMHFGGNRLHRRRTIAIGGALLVHAMALCWLIRPSSGHLGGDTALGPSQTGVEVALFVPAAGDRLARTTTPTPPSPPKAIERFSDMAQTFSPTPPLQTPRPSQSLDQVFGKDLFAATPKAAQAPAPADSRVAIAGRTDHTVNDLWKAVAPCWRRLADKQATGVRLSVSFSSLGNLAKPPVIVRVAAGTVTGHQLTSESLAIAALSQCAPYPMASGQADVRLDFPAGG